MRKRLLASAFAALFATSAIAQPVPQFGVISGVLPQITYSAVSIGLVPPASATDFFCIAGSASRVIVVNEIKISGSGTAITTPIVLLRRAALDTGGTAASTIANPANTVGKHDSQSPTHAATLIAYTANPTINDTSPTYIRAETLSLAAASAAGSGRIEWKFGKGVQGNFSQPLVLRGAAQQACLNLNGVSITSPVIQVSIEWTESAIYP